MEKTTKKTPAVVFAERLSKLRLAQTIAAHLEQQKLDPKGQKLRYISSSYIVYLAAIWQSFIKYLAEESFKRLPREEADERRRNYKMQLGLFNTPKPKNIDTLIEAATGIARITDRWHWEGTTVEQAKGRLSAILEARSNVVRIDNVSPKTSLNQGIKNIEFLIKLADIMCEVIDRHFEA
jgi:hypothetical protein